MTKSAATTIRNICAWTLLAAAVLSGVSYSLFSGANVGWTPSAAACHVFPWWRPVADLALFACILIGAAVGFVGMCRNTGLMLLGIGLIALSIWGVVANVPDPQISLVNSQHYFSVATPLGAFIMCSI